VSVFAKLYSLLTIALFELDPFQEKSLGWKTWLQRVRPQTHPDVRYASLPSALCFRDTNHYAHTPAAEDLYRSRRSSIKR
jgi:hypothetical protein